MTNRYENILAGFRKRRKPEVTVGFALQKIRKPDAECGGTPAVLE